MKKFLSIVILGIIVALFVPFNSADASSIRGKTIAVDAGHGGSDPGASGSISYPDGSKTTIYEKSLTLMFAQYLKEELEFYGADVVMTRNSDTYVGINDRWRSATNANVDAFISIHFDWVQAPNGTMSFYGQNRTQDKQFAQTIHNSIVNSSSYFGNNRGVMVDSNTFHGFLGVLNYGGNYPRVLIEVNNMDYNGLYGVDLMRNATNFARQVRIGLQNYF